MKWKKRVAMANHRTRRHSPCPRSQHQAVRVVLVGGFGSPLGIAVASLAYSSITVGPVPPAETTGAGCISSCPHSNCSAAAVLVAEALATGALAADVLVAGWRVGAMALLSCRLLTRCVGTAGRRGADARVYRLWA